MLKLVGENVALRKKLKTTRASRDSINIKLQTARRRIERLLKKVEALEEANNDYSRECKIADQQINELVDERDYLRKRIVEIESK